MKWDTADITSLKYKLQGLSNKPCTKMKSLTINLIS